jgi:hypothetical protein
MEAMMRTFRKESSKMRTFMLVILAGFLAYIVMANIAGVHPIQSAETAPTSATVDKSETIQAKRSAFIEKAIRLEVFSRIVQNGNTMPRVWTGRSFKTIDFQAKQNALSVVYAYYFDGSTQSDSIAIIDHMNGQEIGRFRKSGLTLD